MARIFALLILVAAVTGAAAGATRRAMSGAGWLDFPLLAQRILGRRVNECRVVRTSGYTAWRM
jgi:hypothetical protein